MVLSKDPDLHQGIARLQLDEATPTIPSSRTRRPYLAESHYESFSLPASRVPSAVYLDSTPASNTNSADFSVNEVASYSSHNSPVRSDSDESKHERGRHGRSGSGNGSLVGSLGLATGSSGSTPASGTNTMATTPGTAATSTRPSFFLLNSSASSPPGSRPGSRDASPLPSPRLFPEPDMDDPYARKLRPPQNQNLSEIEPRFVFKLGRRRDDRSRKDEGHKDKASKRHSSGILSKAHAGGNGSSLGSDSEESSSNGGSGCHHHHHHHSLNLGSGSRHGSMTELKRFFKTGLHKKPGHSSSHLSHLSSGSSPASSGTSTPTHVPFMEETFKKYGKIGRVLGSGAGGSVRIMKRQADGKVFAVKEFREKHANESARDYSKKVTAEFCIGSTLHHPNIIETLDIIKDGGKFYEVMEYCPFDFFAIVMTGQMSPPEIGCCFKQILAGTIYLHELGLAHRDLKLDNCVVSADGIIKIIDFGSASVFRYPFEQDIVMAKGVVGSDPYLAPEVLTQSKYDPRAVDVWSIAIIFCCMTLRRFPWKAPRLSDNSFYAFAESVTIEEAQAQLEHYEKNHAHEHIHGHGGPHVRGPWRLLRLLPEPSRLILGRMLALDPGSRASMEDVWADEWLQSLEMCTIDSFNNLIRSQDHVHTVVPVEQAHLEAYKK